MTILVIDDDKDIVLTVKGNLELDGYEVLTAFFLEVLLLNREPIAG